jgi:hypothetical protein
MLTTKMFRFMCFIIASTSNSKRLYNDKFIFTSDNSKNMVINC